MHSITSILGLEGVCSDESRLACLCGRIYQWLLMVIALWLPFQYYLFVYRFISVQLHLVIIWVEWIAFIMEVILLLYVVNDKKRYVLHNWFVILLTVVIFPLLWFDKTNDQPTMIMRVVYIFFITLPWLSTVIQFLEERSLLRTIFVYIVATILFGMLIALVDQGIANPWHGVWWAFQTVSTVGYGDVIPKSFIGQIFAIVFMVFGVGLLAILTSAFTIHLIKKEDTGSRTLDNVHFRQELADIKAALIELEQRLNPPGSDDDGSVQSTVDKQPE